MSIGRCIGRGEDAESFDRRVGGALFDRGAQDLQIGDQGFELGFPLDEVGSASDVRVGVGHTHLS